MLSFSSPAVRTLHSSGEGHHDCLYQRRAGHVRGRRVRACPNLGRTPFHQPRRSRHGCSLWESRSRSSGRDRKRRASLSPLPGYPVRSVSPRPGGQLSLQPAASDTCSRVTGSSRLPSGRRYHVSSLRCHQVSRIPEESRTPKDVLSRDKPALHHS